jgi:two-component sensor histidine kinase
VTGWAWRPHATIRGRLLSLLLLASLPVLLLAVLGSQDMWRGGLDRTRQEVVQERDRVIALNRTIIATTEALLRSLAVALAAEPSLCTEALGRAALPGVSIALREEDGAEHCTGGGGSVLAGPAMQALQGTGAGPQAAVVTLTQPLSSGTGSLVARILPMGGRPDAVYWLIEPGRPPRVFGAPSPAAPPAEEPGAQPVALTLADGTSLLAAAGELTGGLRLAVGLPTGPAQREEMQYVALHLLEVAALLVLSAAAVLLGTGHAVLRPLRMLRDAVTRWDAGARPFEIPQRADLPGELRDLAESIQAGAATLAQREVELRAAISHAELLAGEVHHRVKNNLQTVSSLLTLQANRVSDPTARAEFEAARDRVGALATLHRHLYVEHDPEAIDFGAFISELGAQLFAAVGERPGRRIALEVDAPSLRIGTDQAVPLALVITEAVADALRQGFPEARSGRMAIHLIAGDGRAKLVVEDDGALPRPEDPLRVVLLRGLGRQLGGGLRMEGGRVELDFPLRPPTIRQPVSLRPPTPPPAPSSPA